MTTKTKKLTKKPLKTHLKHLFIPHKGNRYHPHLIRGKGIAIMVGIIVISQLGYNMVLHGNFSVLGQVTTTTINGLLAETNAARSVVSLPALTLNTSLDQAAYKKAQDMLKNNYWAHVSPSGVQPWSWITAAGYNYNTAGENLAKNYDSSISVVTAWLASPTHRANVLNSTYTEVGFAVVDGILQGKNTSLVVAYYAEPALSTVLGSQTPRTDAFVQPQVTSSNPISSIGSIIQSFSPVALGSFVTLMGATAVALTTYQYRSKLPEALRYGWRAHHAAYKAVGFATLAVIILSIGASAGQI